MMESMGMNQILKKMSFATLGLFLAFQAVAAADSGMTTARITTSRDANDISANPPASVNIAQAGRQYVQQQQQRENQTSGRMTETLGFGIGLITLLAVGIIAYAIHPKKPDDELRRS
jgi:hypothetical protein